MHRKWVRLITAAFVVSIFTSAAGLAQEKVGDQAVVTVDAKANSSTGGVGADTGILLRKGDRLIVEVDPGMRWSAGDSEPCPRESNADGIAECYGAHGQDGLSARHGTLVGRIGVKGNYFVIGTKYDDVVQDFGNLRLFYWDSNAEDNEGAITVRISVRRDTRDNEETEPAVGETGTLLVRGLKTFGLRYGGSAQVLIRRKGSSKVLRTLLPHRWGRTKEVRCPPLYDRPTGYIAHSRDIDLPVGDYEAEIKVAVYKRKSEEWAKEPGRLKREFRIDRDRETSLCFAIPMFSNK